MPSWTAVLRDSTDFLDTVFGRWVQGQQVAAPQAGVFLPLENGLGVLGCQGGLRQAGQGFRRHGARRTELLIRPEFDAFVPMLEQPAERDPMFGRQFQNDVSALEGWFSACVETFSHCSGTSYEWLQFGAKIVVAGRKY